MDVLFQVLDVNAAMPSGYRLATKQDVENNKQAMQDLLKATQEFEPAILADGSVTSVDGASSGGTTVSGDIRTGLVKKMVIYDPNSDSGPTRFRVFDRNERLPDGYRLATVQDVQANKEGVREAMPGSEIANLADGSVEGASDGLNIRDVKRHDVGKVLAIQDPHYIPQPTFQLFKMDERLPPGYRLATVEEVQANPKAARAAMPGWEIANLYDGSVDGASYGLNTSKEQRSDAGSKLAVLEMGSYHFGG